MTEERQFLLEAEDRNKSKSGLTAYEIASQELRAWKTNYGALKSDDKLVPVKKQITFTWSEINAYGLTPTPNPKSNAFTSLFRVQEKTQKHILKNVNGIAYPGELLVLMGSSGAGKTTLMNCMTFRNLKSLTISGSIRINDQPVTQTQLAAQSAYVQQDDLFIPYLTVKEHLIFQALVRMDSHFTYVQRMQRVEEVLTELSLKKCENVKIGEPGIVKGISGGERKRLALAAELLTNPSLLFCDEPTSGLDSFMSLNVMQLLKSMAQTGRTVICTLHQPSSEIFLLFDKIGLMAEGRTAFLGSLDEADKFFTKLGAPCPEDYNPADHYIQILSIIPGKEDFCKESLKCICDAFESSTVGVKIKKYVSANKTSVSEESWTNRRGMISPYKVSWCAQFWAVLWRCWLALKRNPSLTNIKFFQVFFTAILFCIIFGKQVYDQEGIMNIDGILYLLLLNTTFLNITNVITVFCGELPLFLREHKNGMYRTDVYFLSKIITDIPIYSLLNAMNVTICYYFTGLNPQWSRWLECVFIMVLVTNAVMGAGYLISTISTSLQMAQTLVTAIVTPFLIFGGMFLNMKSVPSYLQWVADISWFKYGNQALLINQWLNVHDIICGSVPFCERDGYEVLESNGVEPYYLVSSIVTLAILAVVFRILSFLALLHKAYYYE